MVNPLTMQGPQIEFANPIGFVAEAALVTKVVTGTVVIETPGKKLYPKDVMIPITGGDVTLNDSSNLGAPMM